MIKKINGTKVSFYDDSNTEIMFIDYPGDECIWCFNNSDVITITSDIDLYYPLIDIMSQEYIFDDTDILKSYKSNNKLVWYSDCYYNPDDEWSRNSVSYLTIEFVNGVFQLKCTKPIYSIIDRQNEFHVIGFSPLGNGKHAMNISTGLTIQDDFVIKVYQTQFQIDKVKGLHI